MATTTVISRPNPYVGPRPYKQGETIYGRERETSELLDLLIAERIVLLYSPSGAGKSSLLNAAILPKMAEQGFEVLPVMRVNLEPPTGVKLGKDFNRYVYSCLQSIEEGRPEKKRFSKRELAALKFKEYLAKYRERARKENPDLADSPTLLVFDQAEEVIRISRMDRETKLDFFVQMGEVLRDRNIWALVAMREDYLATFDPYLRPIPTRLANRYRLTLLGVDEAMQAIQLPAQKSGVEFPDECARQLVDDLRTILVQQSDGSTAPELGPTVEPVQLQVVCRRLWSNLPSGEKTITLEHIKALGDVNRALGDYYSLQVASVASGSGVPEREIREWFDRKLITVSRIRGQVLMTPEKSDGLDNKAIWMLERTYLIRAEKRGGATWFELSHDRLVRPVRENNAGWFDKNLNVLQRQADVWNQQARPGSLLLRGPAFLTMQEWALANTSIMTDVEKDFYNESLKAYQSARREHWANILIRWLFAASVIAALIAAGFYLKSHIAEQNAVARELAAASLSNLQSDPERSALLALAGLDVTSKPRPEILQALHQALPEMRVTFASDQENGHTSRVYSVDYSPDGKFLASASKDGTVIIWDAATLTPFKKLLLVKDVNAYNGYGAFAAAYSPDGKSLASVGADGKLTVWDTSGWQVRYQKDAHKGQARAVVYSPDGKYIGTGGEDGLGKVWDAASGEMLHEFGGANIDPAGLETITFSVDSTLLFTGGDDDKIVYAWDLASGQLAYKLNAPGESNTINGLAASPDGKLLASSGSDRLIRVWNLETKDEMEIPGHIDWVWGLAFTSDSKMLVSASSDRTIRLWDTRYGRSQMVLTGPTDQIFAVALSPDGRQLASASADGIVRLWDISPAGSREVLTLDHGDRVHDVQVSPDGKLYASAGNNGVVNVWDSSTGAVVKKLQSGSRSAEALSWSRDGHTLAAGYSSGQAVLWDMTSYLPVLTIPGEALPVWGVSLSPDGSMLATGDDASVTHVYDAKSGKEIVKLDANKQFNWLGSGRFSRADLWVSAAIFSPDGKYLAASYGTKLVVIWDWKSGKPWLTLIGHTDIVENVAYNADGSLLASASDDGTAILWDLNPKLENHFKMKLVGHSPLVYDVAFSPDGKYLATGSADGLVEIWDVNTGNSIFNLYGNDNRVHAVAFAPDGRHVLSGSTDHTVRVFTLDSAELVSLARARVTRALTDPECKEYMNMSCADFAKPDILRPLTDLFANVFGW